MARPPKDDFSKRSLGLRLRLTPAEHAWIKVLSDEDNTSMREVLWTALQDKVRVMGNDKIAELSAKVVQEMKKKKRRKA
jgi:hypothetical protein